MHDVQFKFIFDFPLNRELILMEFNNTLANMCSCNFLTKNLIKTKSV